MPDISKRINDQITKWIGIPVTGVLALNLSGFINISSRPLPGILIDYLCFIFISAVLWNGNVIIHYSLRIQLYRIKKIYFRIPVRYGITILFSWLVSLVLLVTWNWAVHHAMYSYKNIFFSQVIMMLISFQISTFYEIVYLNNERESDLVKVERSEKLRVQAQLDALKAQIDPHFIFNSLNTLSYLISRDQFKAKLFNDTLANVYRYILSNKEKDLVLLSEEIEFARNYFYLMKIRYPQGLHMIAATNNISAGDYLIPPLSLQALIENAVKHNRFSEKQPLNIMINIDAGITHVTNNKSNKNTVVTSSKIGLLNLDKRYKLIVNKNISISQDEHYFSVELPLLKWK